MQRGRRTKKKVKLKSLTHSFNPTKTTEVSGWDSSKFVSHSTVDLFYLFYYTYSCKLCIYIYLLICIYLSTSCSSSLIYEVLLSKFWSTFMNLFMCLWSSIQQVLRYIHVRFYELQYSSVSFEVHSCTYSCIYEVHSACFDVHSGTSSFLCEELFSKLWGTCTYFFLWCTSYQVTRYIYVLIYVFVKYFLASLKAHTNKYHFRKSGTKWENKFSGVKSIYCSCSWIQVLQSW